MLMRVDLSPSRSSRAQEGIIGMMNERLEAKLKTLPRSPGVYFHKAKDGEIIYVGKAAILKKPGEAIFSKFAGL